MRLRTKFILFLCLMVWVVVPTFAQRDTPADGLIDVMRDTRGLSKFADMIEFLGLDARYNNLDVFYTVFALDDDAVDVLLTDLGYDNLDELNENDQLTLTVLLTYHFLPGAYNEATFESVQAARDGDAIQLATALPGVAVTYDDGTVDGISKIIDTDIAAGNGYIHVLDTYLIPTKDAFQRSIDVVKSDTELTQDQSSQQTIAENLQNADQFSMITEAFETLGLLDDLENKGPYTVFVMSNESLNNALDSANVEWEDLLADEEGMTRLLMYHIVPGQYSSTGLQELDQTFIGTMLAHTVVGFGVSRGDITVNEVPVIVSDVIATNGIIHVIDGVLLPPAAR